jgi:RNA polymerase sigma factor (sigma-70 family)
MRPLKSLTNVLQICWALDDALTNLAEMDPRKAQIVELKYFGGMTIEEAAEALEVSTPTVERDWHLARIWLHREISQTR